MRYVLTILSTALPNVHPNTGEFNDYCGKIAAGRVSERYTTNALNIAKTMLDAGVSLEDVCDLPA